MVLPRKVWRLVGGNPVQREKLAREVGVSPLVAQVLINRGIRTPEEARDFLLAPLSRSHDPFRMKDMDKAVERLRAAIAKREPILIYGDYDVDGVTGTALMVTVLRELGARVSYYIPERLQEGYGLNLPALKWAAREGYRLIFTVDCGSAGVEEVAAGRELGLDFIITDHHQPQEQLPPASAVLAPKQPGCNYPFRELAGVGVAFKVVQALGCTYGYGREWWQQYLDLVALGTIADIVPLLDENRVLVKHGLKVLQESQRVGIRALLEVTGLAGRELTPGHIGFVLGPRLNACGRLGEANRGVELLVTSDPELARELAEVLDRQNRVRQDIEAAILSEARARVEGEIDLERERVLVLDSPQWHPGVIGIVASRLVEEFYRPTVLVSFREGTGKGSARSIPGFHLFDALCQCRELLVRFGGHEQAAGLTVEQEKLPALRQRLNELAWTWLGEEQLRPVQAIDAEVRLDELDFNLLEDLERLAPFGIANPEPVFACRRAQLLECREVGENGKHLKLRVWQGGSEVEGIGFRLGELARQLKDQAGVDLAFTLERNYWQGKSSLQLVVRGLAVSCSFPGNQGGERTWQVEDRRGQTQEHVLINLLRGERGSLVYVNTARQAEAWGRLLREKLPNPGRVAVYHAGLSEGERARILRALLSGAITVLLATPFFALAENLAEFHQVVWLDLNFNPREFRRLCYLVGKPGGMVKVYLLYGQEAAERNRRILAELVPDRRVLGAVYLLLQQARREGYGEIEKGKLLKLLQGQKGLRVQPHTLTSALSVLADLNLIRTSGHDTYIAVEREEGSRIELKNSKVYRNKVRERDTYLAFQEFLLTAPAAEIASFLRGEEVSRFTREEAIQWT